LLRYLLIKTVKKQALASQAYIDKIPKYVNPVDRQSTKDFIAKIPKYVAPIDRQATKDFINKIPSYVAPVDRQATKILSLRYLHM
jgi:hypothetical protein